MSLALSRHSSRAKASEKGSRKVHGKGRTVSTVPRAKTAGAKPVATNRRTTNSMKGTSQKKGHRSALRVLASANSTNVPAGGQNGKKKRRKEASRTSSSSSVVSAPSARWAGQALKPAVAPSATPLAPAPLLPPSVSPEETTSLLATLLDALGPVSEADIDIQVDAADDVVDKSVIVETIRRRYQRIKGKVKEHEFPRRLKSSAAAKLVAEAVVQEMVVALLLRQKADRIVIHQATNDRVRIYTALKQAAFCDWGGLEIAKQAVTDSWSSKHLSNAEAAQVKQLKKQLKALSARHKQREALALEEVRNALEDKTVLENRLNDTPSHDSLVQQLKTSKEDNKCLEVALAEARLSLSHASRRSQAAREQLEKEKASKKQMEGQVTNLNKRLQGMATTFNGMRMSLKTKLQAKANNTADFDMQCRFLESQTKAQSLKLQDMERDYGRMQAIFEEEKSSNTVLVGAAESLKHEVAKVKRETGERYKNLKEKYSNVCAYNHTLQIELEGSRASCKKMTEALASTTEECTALTVKLQTAQAAKDDALEQVEAIQDEVSRFKFHMNEVLETRDRAIAEKHFMEEQMSSRLSGDLAQYQSLIAEAQAGKSKAEERAKEAEAAIIDGTQELEHTNALLESAEVSQEELAKKHEALVTEKMRLVHTVERLKESLKATQDNLETQTKFAQERYDDCINTNLENVRQLELRIEQLQNECGADSSFAAFDQCEQCDAYEVSIGVLKGRLQKFENDREGIGAETVALENAKVHELQMLCAALKKQVNGMELTVASAEKKRDVAETSSQRYKDEIVSLNEESTDAKERLQISEIALRSSGEAIRSAKEQIEFLGEELRKVRESEMDLKGKLLMHEESPGSAQEAPSSPATDGRHEEMNQLVLSREKEVDAMGTFVEEAEGKIKSLTSEREALVAQLETAANDLLSTKERLSALECTRNEQASRIESLTSKVTKYESDRASHEEWGKEINERMRMLMEENSAIIDKRTETKSLLDESQAALEKLQSKYDQTIVSLHSNTEKLSVAFALVEESRSSVQFEKELQTTKELLRETEEKLMAAEEERDSATCNMERVTKQLHIAKQAMVSIAKEKTHAKLAASEVARAEMQDQLKAASEEVEMGTKEVEAAGDSLKELSEKLSVAVKERQIARDELLRLTVQLNSLDEANETMSMEREELVARLGISESYCQDIESELQQIKGHVQATKEKHAGAVGALSQELDAEREKSVRFGVLEKEALALRENLDILKAELELAEAKTGDIGEMQEKIAEMEAQHDSAKLKIEEMSDALLRNGIESETQFARKEEQLQALAASHAQAQSELLAQKSAKEECEERLSMVMEEMEGHQREMSGLKTAHTLALKSLKVTKSTDKAAATAELGEVKAAFLDLKEKHAALSAAAETSERVNEEHRRQIDALQTSFDKEKANSDILALDRDATISALKETEQKLASLRDAKRHLEDQAKQQMAKAKAAEATHLENQTCTEKKISDMERDLSAAQEETHRFQDLLAAQADENSKTLKVLNEDHVVSIASLQQQLKESKKANEYMKNAFEMQSLSKQSAEVENEDLKNEMTALKNVHADREVEDEGRYASLESELETCKAAYSKLKEQYELTENLLQKTQEELANATDLLDEGDVLELPGFIGSGEIVRAQTPPSGYSIRSRALSEGSSADKSLVSSIGDSTDSSTSSNFTPYVAYTPLAVKIQRYAAELSGKLKEEDDEVESILGSSQSSSIMADSSASSSGKQKASPKNPPRSLTQDLEGAAEAEELRREVERLRMYNKVLVRGIKRMQGGEQVSAPLQASTENSNE